MWPRSGKNLRPTAVGMVQRLATLTSGGARADHSAAERLTWLGQVSRKSLTRELSRPVRGVVGPVNDGESYAPVRANSDPPVRQRCSAADATRHDRAESCPCPSSRPPAPSLSI